MTPITRLLTFTLVLLLALLVAASTTRWIVGNRPGPKAEHAVTAGYRSAQHSGAVAQLDRGILALGTSALIIAVVLGVALGMRSHSRKETRAPFSSRERERRSLNLLATTSARAQEELDRERDEREKAQADAQQRLQLLNHALEEKIRMGRDLHDGVIQSLYAAGLTLESVQAQTSQAPAKARDQLKQSLTLINRSITDIRSYINGLSPRAVRRDSLTTGLAEVVEELRAGRPLDVDWQIDEAIVAEMSDAQFAESMQITREAVSNALRHGGASRLSISLTQGMSGSEFSLRDDGRGFDLTQVASHGHGLANMRARAEDAWGEFTLTSEPGKGTCIKIRWQTAGSV